MKDLNALEREVFTEALEAYADKQTKAADRVVGELSERGRLLRRAEIANEISREFQTGSC